ncbi:lipid IV(A) 3-deoxy-D-manno-octulosonic acid transferase [Piscirickettsia salmonis]|uniref:3-deoxy-D-manno-octulosonic acid transferase n=2 Tax=Piscirickettsia salmonis TaxID=1238 RepID=A0A9Q6PRT8_PISSA|nr:lipid IV(A) 3-deoxy-D-manno-octulosonic acid transferase [Piscirickettsia salmonis]ERL62940.1 glycosyl transferases group 1 family protein [Piscirickettsia salmonis LF-89 = ATCC VR-1361]ALA24175.1 glycosyl hydrolase family 1 [Piscirickettsia salmonis]QGN76546.1 3-deoxy-D-manno-octulosonic acid transferase [Piscirickettsia salmonis]QGN80136.1 3-deoxy-D-manno-octulosonic acid transferase [Piscirickettsia salmonis]QGN85591.1 3-deoxy-D-manno-octulosonic acid transferase [Piscirickettsia salmoni
MRRFYTCCFYLLLPVIFLRLWYKGRKLPAYRRRWLQRLGWVKIPKEYQHGLWIHAASVGEAVAASMLVKTLREQGDKRPIVMTTMTPTGSEQIQRSLAGDEVYHVFVPYDLPCAVRRFLDSVQPKVLILIETEVWPNLLAEAKHYDIPCVLVNARLSARSAAGYQRLKGFSRWMMRQFDVILAQTRADAERFIQLGAHSERVKICGNVKYDLSWPENLARDAALLRRVFGETRPVVTVASTHKGEEELILRAFEIVWQTLDVVLVLVPRHPNRFAEVKKLCIKTGKAFACRSDGDDNSKHPDQEQQVQLYLGDSMGEMGLYYQVADITVVAGSFQPIGGHNMLEPASLGKAVITGPHVFNFTQVAQLLADANAAIKLAEASDSQHLAGCIMELLSDPDKYTAMGERGQAVVKKHQGASLATLDEIRKVMKSR